MRSDLPKGLKDSRRVVQESKSKPLGIVTPQNVCSLWNSLDEHRVDQWSASEVHQPHHLFLVLSSILQQIHQVPELVVMRRRRRSAAVKPISLVSSQWVFFLRSHGSLLCKPFGSCTFSSNLMLKQVKSYSGRRPCSMTCRKPRGLNQMNWAHPGNLLWVECWSPLECFFQHFLRLVHVPASSFQASPRTCIGAQL